jgi:hypothetical protein
VFALYLLFSMYLGLREIDMCVYACSSSCFGLTRMILFLLKKAGGLLVRGEVHIGEEIISTSTSFSFIVLVCVPLSGFFLLCFFSTFTVSLYYIIKF